MDKSILIQYSDALARVKLLREHLGKKQRQLDRIGQHGYVVSDSVTLGKRGKKPLGTIRITGYPVSESQRASKEYEKQYENLMKEEQGLLDLQTMVEEYISGIEDIEMRNIMTLYYVEDLPNWVQVAHGMNCLYPKRSYTESSCRQKHDRFLEKF